MPRTSIDPESRPSAAKPRTGAAIGGPAPVAPGPTSPSQGGGLALPHERDESTGSVSDAPDPVVAQAKRDLDAGLVDTDMWATPGLDAKRRTKLVPGPGGKPPPKAG